MPDFLQIAGSGSRFRQLAPLLAVALFACKDATGPDLGKVTTVRIEPSPVHVQRNGSVQLQAITLNVNGDTLRGRDVSWQVLSPQIGEVSEGGLVTGIQAGTTEIRATVGSVSALTQLTVSGFSSRAEVSDNFTTYANTAGFLSNVGSVTRLYPVGVNTNLLAIDPNVRYDGHQTLRIDQPAGTLESAVLFAYFPRPLADMWFRTKVRFSPGWTSVQTSPGGADTFMHWGWAANVGHRGEISFVNNGEYRLSWYADGAQRLVAEPAGDVSSEWTDGQWYDYIVHYEHVDNTTARTRLWLARAGQTPTLRATVIGTMASGTPPRAIRLQLAPEFASPVPAAQSVWLGEWEVIDGDKHPDPFGLGS